MDHQEVVLCDVKGCGQPADMISPTGMSLCSKHNQELNEAAESGPIAVVELWARFKGYQSLDDLVEQAVKEIFNERGQAS